MGTSDRHRHYTNKDKDMSTNSASNYYNNENNNDSCKDTNKKKSHS